MKKQLAALFMAGALASGCAATHQDRAVRYGVVSKQVVDSSAEFLTTYLESKERECQHLAEVSRDQLVSCLGPVAGNPDAIDVALELVHAKQLALFVAISEDRSPEAIRDAQNALITATTTVIGLVKQAKGETK
jgi:hypothetical protein